MNGDSSPIVLLSLCGITLACLGVLGIGAFLLVKTAGGSLFQPIMGLFGQAKDALDDDDDGGRAPRPGVSAPRFDARAQAGSFDAQVSQYRQPPGSVPPGTFGAQSAPPPPTFGQNPRGLQGHPVRPSSQPPASGFSAPPNAPPPALGGNPRPALGDSPPPPPLRGTRRSRGETDHDVDDDLLG